MSLVFEELPELIPCQLWPENLKGVLGFSAIDTRRIQPGEVFWALTGDKADGHAFIADAFLKGASAVVVSHRWFREHRDHSVGSFVIVGDPLNALQNLAVAYRKRFHIPLIALTGSNGKTATKELLGAALSKRFKVLKNAGNFNNHIGVPLTLLGITPETEIVLTEMGTNHPGEIAALCRMAAPTAGLVLNVGPAHLEGFGEVQAVAHEKGSLLKALPESGMAFINFDDPFVRAMTTTASQKICFGFDPAMKSGQCTIEEKGELYPTTSEGKGVFKFGDTIFSLTWLGNHQTKNALAAAVVAKHFEVSLAQIAEAFAQLPPLKGRLETTIAGGITIIDDSYNANPASTQAALDFLAGLKTAKRRIAILGDNLELGPASEDLHRRIGISLKRRGLHSAYFIGDQMAYAWQECAGEIEAEHFPSGTNYDEVIDKIAQRLKPGDAVLIKASRGIGLDNIARGLIANLTKG